MMSTQRAPVLQLLRMAWRLGPALLIALLVPAVGQAQDSAKAASPAAKSAETAGQNPRVSMTVSVDSEDGRRTELGSIVIELYPKDAPKHVENFLKLAGQGFYTGLTFHRIVPAFVVQGGDPQSRSNWQSNRLGTGGPGYNLPAEIGRKHVRGAVAAARQGDTLNPNKESSGSQFYICLADLPSLDRSGYTVFGQVVDPSMDVVDKIARVKNTGPPQNQAMQRVIITNVHVVN